MCTECSKEKSIRWYSDKERAAAKTKKWRSENKERDQENTRKWREENRDKLKVYEERYRENNPELAKANWKRWYDKNIDNQRKRSLEYRHANLPERQSYQRNYNKKNQSKLAAHKRNRRAREISGGTHTERDILEIFKYQRGRCGYCRKKIGNRYHVDHVTPLAKGGSNGRKNLQILCPPCNQSKSAKDPIDFARSKGLLI